MDKSDKAFLTRSFKIEIAPTEKQKKEIDKTIDACTFIYNYFIDFNEAFRANNNGLYLTGDDFKLILNHVLVRKDQNLKWTKSLKCPLDLNLPLFKEDPDVKWIKSVSSKAISEAISDCGVAYYKYLSDKGKFQKPCYKKYGDSHTKMYFVKNNSTDCLHERHRIKIPKLGWVKFKEKNYLPADIIIKSGRISHQAGRYYISLVPEKREFTKIETNDFGIGIDLGIKNLAILSNGIVIKNINNTSVKLKRLEKHINHEQNVLRKKQNAYEINKEGSKKNINKEILKLNKLYKRTNNIKNDYINKCVNDIVKLKPSYFAIEDLDIEALKKNKYNAKNIANAKLYYFRTRLIQKCQELGIEVRIVDRWFASSQICNVCGFKNSDIKNLRIRKWKCPKCGTSHDRDINAAKNLRDAKSYRVGF